MNNIHTDSGHTDIGHPDIVLETRNLHRTYREGDLVVPVLKGIDLAVRKGEMVAIVGASGSGKSSSAATDGGLGQTHRW